MKIIRPGKTKEDVTWIGRCNKCGAIVSAKELELTDITMGDYRTDHEHFAWDNCPYCKAKKSICFYEETSKTGQRILIDSIKGSDSANVQTQEPRKDQSR